MAQVVIPDDLFWNAEQCRWALPFESQPPLFAEDCQHCSGTGHWGITGSIGCKACRGTGSA